MKDDCVLLRGDFTIRLNLLYIMIGLDKFQVQISKFKTDLKDE
jgi:hypothetical protein